MLMLKQYANMWAGHCVSISGFRRLCYTFFVVDMVKSINCLVF